MATSLERLEALENSVNELKEIVAGLNQSPMLQMVAEKSVGIEQSMISISKTLAAISEELIETGVMKSDGVMARLRDASDAEQINQIKTLRDSKMLVPTDTVGEDSIVVVRQVLVDTTTGDSKVLSNYRIVSMSHPQTNQVIRANLLAKTVKGTVEGTLAPGKKDIITVKEIYSLQETEVQGEQPEATQAEEGVSFDTPDTTQDQGNEAQPAE